VVENSGNALFDRALWGIDALDLGGTMLVDSYDPKLGAYGGSNIWKNGSVGPNGSVALNGTSLEVQGTPDVHFDEGCLEKNLLQRQFRINSWSKNSF
jgi:hypothetical protein